MQRLGAAGAALAMGVLAKMICYRSGCETRVAVAGQMCATERGYLALAVDTLQGHALDDLLAANGLIGPQRVAKTASIDHAVEERRQKRGWKPLKALLGYLDSVLGSLVKALPWLEPVKEFKEITEKSAELANDVVPR